MHFAELGQVWTELATVGGRYETEKVVVRGKECLAFKHAPDTLRDVWLASVSAFADRDYIIFRDERLTYADALRTSQSIGAWLQSLGVVQGDRVAIAMRNYPEWMLIYWACISCGITVCGFNAWWSSAEMGRVYAETRPKAVFVDAERLERLQKVRPSDADDAVVVVRDDAEPLPCMIPWREVAAHGGEPMLPSIAPDDDACIFYTSGTSGPPKGAILSHRNCVTNILNVLFAAEVQGMNLLVAYDAQSTGKAGHKRRVVIAPVALEFFTREVRQAHKGFGPDNHAARSTRVPAAVS